MNHTLTRSVWGIRKVLTKNSPSILAGMAITGVIATAVLSAKCTVKALDLLENSRKENLEKLPILTTVQVYSPAIFVGSLTIACIIGSHNIANRRQIALMSAYALKDRTLDKYRQELGKEKVDEIESSIREENLPDWDSIEKCMYNHGEELFYEEFSGRYFRSNIKDVITAEYYMNQTFAERGYIYLNDFYMYLGIEQTPLGDSVGWSFEELDHNGFYWLDFVNRDMREVDGSSCTVIEYPYGPSTTFLDF